MSWPPAFLSLCYASGVRPLILVSNDDGIHAPGIKVLARTMAEFGDVIVSAPDTERSAQSHAITLRSTLRQIEVQPGWFAVAGTPVDSVYLGALHLADRVPDIVAAGINAGYNLGTDVYYSGTVGAAREGRLRGCSAIAASVKGGGDPEVIVPALRKIMPVLIDRHARGERHLINVNAPDLDPRDPSPDIVCTRLGVRKYQDRVDERQDLQGRPYFWIGGPPAPGEGENDGDVKVVNSGRIAVTPLGLDMTAPDLPAWGDAVGGAVPS